jgi:TusA-related sulfurtransferase
MRAPDKTLDVQGIAGVRARALAHETLEMIERGQVLKVITTEKNAKKELVELCREEGYLLLDEVVDGSLHSFLIQRQRVPAARQKAG